MTPSFDPAHYYVAFLALNMSPIIRERFALVTQRRAPTPQEAREIARKLTPRDRAEAR